MPSIGFTLPHWMFWAALLLFPPVAWALAERTKNAAEAGRPNLPLAYVFWFFGGFLGLHRIYLRSLLGLLYLPLFLVVIWGGSQWREAREINSKARSEVESLNRIVDRARPTAERGNAAARNRLDEAIAKLEPARAAETAAQGLISRSVTIMRAASGASLAFLLLDALLLPGLVRRLRLAEPPPAISEADLSYPDERPENPPGPLGQLAKSIDVLVRGGGEFVMYWAVLAVFAYYFEVIGRYVFNSPTNWVHESTFIMFGMQYMVAGAYAYRGESHVRVDLLYTHLSPRGKALCDIIGSIFVLIFLGTMLVTGWTFASQSFSDHEVSFTEWGIQYWPVKLMIPLGAALMILQAIARLIRDVHTIRTKTAQTPLPRAEG
jgi:TRAP-type mannitol/chloroaromatic compound transport system permease small subunit